MWYSYEPFVLRRFAENRIFVVNPKMPFEMFVDCFYCEHPFFLVSCLDDGRVAITPNPTVVPLSSFQAGRWPCDIFPTEWEYVAIKNETYPVIVTAHPVAQFDDWCKRFEKKVYYFAKETLASYISGSKEFLPLEFEYESYDKAGKSKETIKA